MSEPARSNRERAERRLADGWRALGLYGRRGRPALDEALAAFRDAGPMLRDLREHDALVLLLLGETLALRLGRRAEQVEQAVVRAQELVNLSRRLHGEAAALRHHAQVELAWRDLADLAPERRDAALDRALDLNDRTLKAARAQGLPDLVLSETALRADLLLRRARASSPPDPRAVRRAADLYRDALAGWPAGEDEGRGQVWLGLAEALLAAGAAGARAEPLLRDAIALFERLEHRVLLARAHYLLALLLLRQDREEAIAHQERAVALYRDLDLGAERREAEALLA